MQLALYRYSATSISTQGKLFVDGAFFCFTLELPVKDGLLGSAIPAGIGYEVSLQPSPKFQALAIADPWFARYAGAMPHIVGIPGRSLIMLHPGNMVSQTDGCVLIGDSEGINVIGTSRPAFARLYPLIQRAGRPVAFAVYDPPASNHDAVQDALEP